MTGQILFRVALPALLIAALLVGACLVAVQSIEHLEINSKHILSKNVQSLLAAQRLELGLRQLRFHSFLFVMEPTKARRDLVEEDFGELEKSLAKATEATDGIEQHRLLEAVRIGYENYRSALARQEKQPVRDASREEFLRWADTHSLRDLRAPCEDLLRLTENSMNATAAESQDVGERTRGAMILVGILGPVSGLVGGYFIARGLSRTLTQLVVRVQDLHAQLDQEVETVGLTAGTRLSDLDRQLNRVVARVREVVIQVQQHRQDMLRAEQLAAVGQLAAGMAHEVRNPLSSIKLLIGRARRAGPADTLSQEDLEVIYVEIERLEAKVRRLLEFARPVESQRRPCDLRDVISRSIALVRSRAILQHVEIASTAPKEVVPVLVDPDQFGSVLVNLLMNALDAMPTGGHLALDLTRDSGGLLRLMICDSGPGISDGMKGRLFVPFASSKPTGTGLGLSISRRVVEEHGGRLTAANRPDGPGACFTILLPEHEGENHADSPDRG